MRIIGIVGLIIFAAVFLSSIREVWKRDKVLGIVVIIVFCVIIGLAYLGITGLLSA
ncbi:MAG: hypothetical protein ACLT5F_00560 [Anaerotignaceae bacterium]|nr:hypothetical protein [Eubacterium sp.]